MCWKDKTKTTQTLVGGFKDTWFEVGVEPAKREFRATSPHVSAREEEEEKEDDDEEVEGWMASVQWSDSPHFCEHIWSYDSCILLCCVWE